MTHSISEELLQPSQKALNFLKMFARNYRAVTLSNGETVGVILS